MKIAEVASFVQEHYGIKSVESQKLEGYGSINYRISDNNNNRYVVKHYTNKPDFPIVTEEIKILQAIQDQVDFAVPVTLPDNNGQLYTIHDDGSLTRVVKYIGGQFLSEVPNTPDLLFSFGEKTAQLRVALQQHESAPVKARRLFWDIQYSYLNYPLLKYIDSPADRKLISYFFDQFQQVVLPALPWLREGLIHGDLNDNNVLVSNNAVTGFIDFGDLSWSPLVNELAIAITYIMLGKAEPFEAAAHFIRGYQSVFAFRGSSSGLEQRELELLPQLITARICISLCNSAQAKANSNDTEYILLSEKPARELLHRWLTVNPLAITNGFLEAAGFTPDINTEHKKEILEKRLKYFGRSLSLSYSVPVYFTKAAFQYMYDGDGNTYLDAYNNIPHVGHSHPAISEAASRQIRLLNTNTRYYYDSLADYAERLLSYFPARLNKIFFVNSGSAATDLALRMANTYTQAHHHIVLESGYHGNTSAAIQVSAYKFEGKGGGGKPGNITMLPLPNTFNGKYATAQEYIQQAIQQIEALANNNIALSSFIGEPVSGCGGQVPMPPGYLQHLYSVLKKHRAITICDEVQTGFGRLGKWFWGFEMNEVVPDIVILGKPMGNGHPVAAVVTTEEIADRFANGMEFFSSFGGNTVSAVIADAVLGVLEAESLQQQALETGDHFIASLQALQKEHPCLGDVRGAGLFLGMEFVEEDGKTPATPLASHVKNKLKENYILTGTDGKYDNVIKIKPPLCFNKHNADTFCAVLETILKDYKKLLTSSSTTSISSAVL